MQCNHPIWLEKHLMLVPCGKCRACKIAKAREWAVRLMHESDSYKSNSFVTLTYSDDHLPKSESLEKAALQRHFKRLRKQVGTDHKIKYYACGEYGERKKRPHYHYILFGLGVEHKNIIENAWKLGSIFVGNVTYDSCRYVADYVGKNIYTENDALKMIGKELPFNLMSQGIGKQHCLTNAKQYTENLSLTCRGSPLGLPKYYKKLLNIDTEVLYEKSLAENPFPNAEYLERYGNSNDALEAIQRSRRQKELNIKKRSFLREKGVM